MNPIHVVRLDLSRPERTFALRLVSSSASTIQAELRNGGVLADISTAASIVLWYGPVAAEGAAQTGHSVAATESGTGFANISLGVDDSAYVGKCIAQLIAVSANSVPSILATGTIYFAENPSSDSGAMVWDESRFATLVAFRALKSRVDAAGALAMPTNVTLNTLAAKLEELLNALTES